MIFNQHIAVLRASKTRSPYGHSAPSWDSPLRIPVDFPVSVQPSASSEGPAEREQVVTSWRLYSPPGTDLDLRPGDRVEVGGTLVMDVVGQPMRWPDPFQPGHVHHVEAVLEAVDG